MTWNQYCFKGISYRCIFTLGACLLTITPLFAEEFSAQEAILLKRITEYWKEGDIEVAKSQITSYLSKFPTSIASDSLYAMLGDIFLKEKKFDLALEQYKKVRNEDIQTRIGFNKAICLYEQKQNDELIHLVTKTLAYPVQIKESDTLQFFLAESFFRKATAEDSQEKKLALLTESLSHYKSLLESKYSEQALLPAAEISELIGRKQDACHFYEMILQTNPQDVESILYKIATLQEEKNPIAAIETFGKVYRLRGTKAPDAAMRQLQTLFQHQKFTDLIIKQEEALVHINTENLPLAHYWIGLSLLSLQDFTQAKEHLMSSLMATDLILADQKILITSLITCARATKDAALLQNMIRKWEEINADDLDLAEAYLIQHHTLVNTNPAGACRALEKLIEKFPEHKEKESVLFHLGVLQYNLKSWPKAAVTFASLVQEFPSSQFNNLSWRMHINCLIEDCKSANPETAFVKKIALGSQLKNVLTIGKALNKEEKTQYHFVYCQILAQTNQAEEALTQLADYIDNNPEAKNLGRAYIMMAELYSKSEDEPILFISCAEKALLTEQELPDLPSIHLRLYNGYLKLANAADEKEKTYLISQAANHLYYAYLNGSPVHKTNLNWLSDYFFQQAKESSSSLLLEQGITLLEHVLKIQSYPPSAKLQESSISSETEMLKLAELLGLQSKANEQIDVLEALIYQQKNYPNLAWKFQRQSLLELARAYAHTNNPQDALDTYNHLIESSVLSPSYIANIAVIEKSQLRYALLSQSHIEEDNPELLSLLDALKDLEIKKRLHSEPTHLEAALTYIQCKTSHLHPDKQREKSLHLLQMARQNFSSNENLSAKEYLESCSIYPEKAIIHESYMKFIDASICRKKAEIAMGTKNKYEAHRLLKQARQSLYELAENPCLPSNLLTRVRSDMESMENTL